MDRRTFLKSLIYNSLIWGVGLNMKLPGMKAHAQENPFPATHNNVLVNMILDGGPDFRHIFAPEYSSDINSYGHHYWSKRYTSHYIDGTEEAFQTRWNNDYLPINSNGVVFGVLNKAGWLKKQFDEGNVAIVNNISFSTTRDHAHSLIVLESGDFNAGPHDVARDGWGGRLAKACQGNIISTTWQVRLFCNGPHESNPLKHNNESVISARDSRNITLYSPENLKQNPSSTDTKSIMSRALTSYYKGKRDSLATASPYYKFLHYEKVLREFGNNVQNRLKDIPVPEAIAALYEDEQTILKSSYIGRQCRNVYDSFACSDIFNLRIASMEYPLWDSHKKQVDWIEPKIEDLFGDGKAFDILTQCIKNDMPDAYEKMIILVSGEFGRQLASNGDRGTDHGKGNSVLLIGKPVKGGIYGEMFPQSEIEEDFMGRTKYDIPNTDIEGLTSMEQIFGTICDWVHDGSGDNVFPGRKSSIIEPGLDLSQILS